MRSHAGITSAQARAAATARATANGFTTGGGVTVHNRRFASSVAIKNRAVAVFGL